MGVEYAQTRTNRGDQRRTIACDRRQEGIRTVQSLGGTSWIMQPSIAGLAILVEHKPEITEDERQDDPSEEFGDALQRVVDPGSELLRDHGIDGRLRSEMERLCMLVENVDLTEELDQHADICCWRVVAGGGTKA